MHEEFYRIVVPNVDGDARVIKSVGGRVGEVARNRSDQPVGIGMLAACKTHKANTNRVKSSSSPMRCIANVSLNWARVLRWI